MPGGRRGREIAAWTGRWRPIFSKKHRGLETVKKFLSLEWSAWMGKSRPPWSHCVCTIYRLGRWWSAGRAIGYSGGRVLNREAQDGEASGSIRAGRSHEMLTWLNHHLGLDWTAYLSLFIGVIGLPLAVLGLIGAKRRRERIVKQEAKVGDGVVIQVAGDAKIGEVNRAERRSNR